MCFEKVLPVSELPKGSKKTVKLGDVEVLLIHTEEGVLHAVEAKCPHAGAPLEQGAVCNGKLVCPWHAGTFELKTGALVEPPPLRSLKTYPVQVVGDSLAIDAKPEREPTLAHRDSKTPTRQRGEHLHFVTIGGGAAATAAVTTLRQAGFAGRITVVDGRAPEPIDRTNLSKMTLAGKMPLEKLPLWSKEECDALKIERLVARVDRLYSKQGTLRLNDGTQFGFDAALLATGGTPRWLDIPGEELRHVFTLRHIRDLEAILRVLESRPNGTETVILGDSFIAFEAASALRTRGVDVTVVCRAEKPFAQRFGEEPAGALVELHRQNGVRLKLGVEAAEITAQAVLLEGGESLPAQLVLVAVGVEPATEFEHDFDVTAEGRIAVDRSLRMTEKLWAAGDVTDVDGLHIEHWRVAQQHGRAAAAGILQHFGWPESSIPTSATYQGVPFFWTAHYGKRFAYVGHAKDWDAIEIDGSLAESNFLAYFVKGGEVKAVFGCGRDTAVAALAESMRASLTLAQARAISAR